MTVCKGPYYYLIPTAIKYLYSIRGVARNYSDLLFRVTLKYDEMSQFWGV